MEDPKLNYKHYPRSVSWQVASVLNPSLQNSLPASQQSKHSRDKKDKSSEAGALMNTSAAASKPWQEEENLPLPPQYVSPGALCKAMPRYMRVKARPDQMRHGNAAAVTTSSSCSNPGCNPVPNQSGNHSLHHHLPFSPRHDVAVGSPRSDHSSAKLTPRSVLDSPKQAKAASDAGNSQPQQATKLLSSTACSPASPARSPCNPPLRAAVAASGTTTPPVSAPHQNTPQTQATSGSRSSLPHSPCGSRRHSGAQSPRIRSAATSPMHPCACRGHQQVMDATSLQSKLNSTIAQHPELQQRVVPHMQSAGQGSPLSPANSSLGRANINSNNPTFASPPVALPPTPPTSGRYAQQQQRRTHNPHPQEPTLETYQKISPNTYATNTVWNDRRDQDSRDRDQTQPRRTILIKSN